MKRIISFLLLIMSLNSGVIEWFPEETSRISTYEENFFLFHWSDLCKVKISAKYNIWSQFYIGYSQLIFWDLFGPSAVIKEINFNPEIFYRLKFKERYFVNWIQLGLYEHISNGKGGINDRSMNRSYISLNSDFFIGKYFNVTLDQKYFYMYQLSSNTRYLYDYLGWYEFKLIMGFDILRSKVIDDFSVYAAMYTGGTEFFNDEKLSLTLGGYTMFLLGPKFHPSIYIEYFRGYAEQLISYTEFDNLIRFGISFN